MIDKKIEKLKKELKQREDKLKQQHEEELKKISEPEQIPKQKKSPNILKYLAYGSLVIVLITLTVSGVFVSMQARSLDAEQSMMTLVYILGSGWMVAILALVPLMIARKEVWNKIKIFGRKSKVIILRLIGADANETDVILTLKGNTVEVGESKLIVNVRKTTMKDGIRVITYVGENALAHDYFQNQAETLKQIGKRLEDNKSEDFHDVYSDPIRIDAKVFHETFLAAQQTNPDILKNIIAFLTSKNVIGMLLIIAVASGIAALLSLQANNLLNDIPFCNPTSITP